MKRLMLVGMFLSAGMIIAGSCSYDDSNDLDVITPNDSIQSVVREVSNPV